MVALFLVYQGIFMMAIIIYIPTEKLFKLPSLYVPNNIYYFLNFW